LIFTWSEIDPNECLDASIKEQFFVLFLILSNFLIFPHISLNFRAPFKNIHPNQVKIYFLVGQRHACQSATNRRAARVGLLPRVPNS
jgi:hypothetical protein